MRAYPFVLVAAAVAAVTAFGIPREQAKPEPSAAEMKSSFSRFLSRLEMRPISEAHFRDFEKHTCNWSQVVSGHICTFSYSTDLTPDELKIFPARGQISGTFFWDRDDQVMFETVVG
jgi:hypothetical protein